MVGVDFCAAQTQDVQHCALVEFLLSGQELGHLVLVFQGVDVAGVGDRFFAVSGLFYHGEAHVYAVDYLHWGCL